MAWMQTCSRSPDTRQNPATQWPARAHGVLLRWSVCDPLGRSDLAMPPAFAATDPKCGTTFTSLSGFASESISFERRGQSRANQRLDAYCDFAARTENVEVHVVPSVRHGYTMRTSPSFDRATHEFSIKRAREILPGLRSRVRSHMGRRRNAGASRARLTTGRREDAPRLGRQHIRDGRVRFRQAKNEHRNPIDIDIPLHPALGDSIAAANVGTNMTFLLTEFGKPFTANGFGNKFKDWCRQADLPHCSAHGVRKATSTALAESGATPHEIMAITGHQTLEEVERYTKAASRKKTADSGMRKLIR